MTHDAKPETTEIPEGLNDEDELPTDGELRATGANGPRISAKSRMPHNVDSQVSHSLVEHASHPNADDERLATNQPVSKESEETPDRPRKAPGV